MNKAEAIRRKCLDCSESPKEVTLCPVFDCPLWQYRFGCSLNTKQYKKRMYKAKQRYEVEYENLMEKLIKKGKYTWTT